MKYVILLLIMIALCYAFHLRNKNVENYWVYYDDPYYGPYYGPHYGWRRPHYWGRWGRRRWW